MNTTLDSTHVVAKTVTCQSRFSTCFCPARNLPSNFRTLRPRLEHLQRRWGLGTQNLKCVPTPSSIYRKTMATKQQARTPLLDFPPELRNNINQHVIGKQEKAIVSLFNFRRSQNIHPLFRVCQQIRNEAGSIFYNRINATVYSTDLLPALERLGPIGCAHVAEIRVVPSVLSLNDSSQSYAEFKQELLKAA